MKPPEMTRIIGGKRYSTKTATLIAGDDYWDGHNWERHGRNCWLYRTPSGSYFAVVVTQWQGERDSLQPIDISEAQTLWEGQLTEHRVEFEDAFPAVVVVDA